MEVINGQWTMSGLDKHDSNCIHTVRELEKYIDEVGFLPLFKNEISGFSVEERTEAGYWWSGDPEHDPWEWRQIIAKRGQIAYGKFFNKKAGFISKKWFPTFANYRRDGYDFDALWDDEKASIRQKKIMDLFDAETELFSFDAKKMAGFGKNGERNFEGVVTDLQMKTYLLACDFRMRQNKMGQEYGWAVAVYCRPEHLWGYEYVTSAYKEEPHESAEKIFRHVAESYPEITVKQIKKVVG